MNELPTHSPLYWPHWFPRTARIERKYGRFSVNDHSITLTAACRRVLEEVARITGVDPADEVVISTNLQLRKDLLPRSGQRAPLDPGAAVWFIRNGRQQCVPCDSYTRVEDNIAGIAATIASLRTIERHGSQMLEAALNGFAEALPAPGQTAGRSWRDVLDYRGSDLAEAKAAYRRARKIAHADHGGSTDALMEVQDAWSQAQSELGRGES